MKVALVILFNHNYEANLGKLALLYGNKFSNIFYIMPYYNGNRKDVISVYGNPIYFQGYIATALQQLKHLKFDHYLIIGDDLLLNPIINQENYYNYFKVDTDSGFVPEFFYLNDVNETKPYRPFAPYWENNSSAYHFSTKYLGPDVEKFLPTYNEALLFFKRHGLNFTPEIPAQMFYRNPVIKNPFKNKVTSNRTSIGIYRQSFEKRSKTKIISYPLIGSYSDCIIIPGDYIDPFIRYCSVFAALQLFVEIGLPTAMVLAIPKIIQEINLDYTGETYWQEQIPLMEDKYNKSLSNLFDSFPARTLYIHPIKFSKWK